MKRLLFTVLLSALPSFVATRLSAQDFSLSTNFADYAEFGTLNLDASYGVSRHWSLNAGMKYNPFTFKRDGADLQHRQRSLSAGARYWPWHVYSGWWLSAAVRYQEYNSGGIFSPQATEGDRFGGSIGGGYSYMIAPHLNLEFGLGLWSGYDNYTSYACPTCGRKVAEGDRFFILPGDILLALTFIF